MEPPTGWRSQRYAARVSLPNSVRSRHVPWMAEIAPASLGAIAGIIIALSRSRFVER